MTIYFDENFPHQYATSLNAIDKKNEILSVTKEFSEIKDIELFEKINNDVLITKDKRMKSFKAEREALLKTNMIVFIYTGTVNEYWTLFVIFVKSWENILKTAKKSTRPAFYSINSNGKIESRS